MRRLAVVVLVLVAACSKSPTAPSNFAQVGGSWSGTLSSSNYQTLAVFLQLTQAGGDITGTWATDVAQANGTITGSVTKSTFSGTFTISTPSTQGGPLCTGTASVSGPASTGATTMTWTSVGFIGSCTGFPTNVTLSLRR